MYLTTWGKLSLHFHVTHQQVAVALLAPCIYLSNLTTWGKLSLPFHLTHQQVMVALLDGSFHVPVYLG